MNTPSGESESVYIVYILLLPPLNHASVFILYEIKEMKSCTGKLAVFRPNHVPSWSLWTRSPHLPLSSSSTSLPQTKTDHVNTPLALPKTKLGVREQPFSYYLHANNSSKNLTNNMQQANSTPIVAGLKVTLLGNRHNQSIPPILKHTTLSPEG